MICGQPLAETLAISKRTGRTSSSTPVGSDCRVPPQPLLDAADLTLFVTRTNLPALSAARSWARPIADPQSIWRQAGLLLVGEGQPYGAPE